MKKLILILISGLLLGIFGKNLHHSFVTGLNPIIAIILFLILSYYFRFEIISLYRNSVKKSINFLAIIINLLFFGGFIYLDVQQIQMKSKNYFSFIATIKCTPKAYFLA